MKLDAPENLINRELSWLEFNRRVLREGLDTSNPLLERLKFLAIVSSNFDEFFMVRVGSLKQLGRSAGRKRCPAGMTPRQQLTEIARRAHEMFGQVYQCLSGDIFPALTRHGMVRLKRANIVGFEAKEMDRFYEEEIFPVLTPLAAEGDTLSTLRNLTLHLAVRLRHREDEDIEDEDAGKPAEKLAIIPLPRSLRRILQAPGGEDYRFILLEDLVAAHIEGIFPGYDILETAPFRITRNADQPLQEDEAADLMAAMEDVLRERGAGQPVRLEIDSQATRKLTQMLSRSIALESDEDLYRIDGPIDLKPFMDLAPRFDAPGLRYSPYKPQPAPAFEEGDDMWSVIAKKDVLLHLPYESFEPVVRLVEEAAEDPQVMAIKQTLYRTSSDSPIISALERAAEAGKQVTVLVELKARFDEEQNISWARRLHEAGAQVIYGVSGLKTHAKALMVVRREAGGVRRYMHLSTGNYHDRTARVYEDMGLFTCDREFGEDGANLFNAITGYSELGQWNRLIIAPTDLRRRLTEMIEREMSKSTPEAPGRIQLKMNSLIDPRVIRQLYKASQAGVQIRLCVRGGCCLRPGIPGLSDNIEVISIVDRFLEHSRIYHFNNGGQEEIYLASADLMPRNLDRRIELLFPILDDDLKERILRLLELVFADNQRTWTLGPDGVYEQRQPEPDEKPLRLQHEFMRLAMEQSETSRLRRLSTFQPKGPGAAPGA